MISSASFTEGGDSSIVSFDFIGVVSQLRMAGSSLWEALTVKGEAGTKELTGRTIRLEGRLEPCQGSVGTRRFSWLWMSGGIIWMDSVGGVGGGKPFLKRPFISSGHKTESQTGFPH